jgi:hypothetical protein
VEHIRLASLIMIFSNFSHINFDSCLFLGSLFIYHLIWLVLIQYFNSSKEVLRSLFDSCKIIELICLTKESEFLLLLLLLLFMSMFFLKSTGMILHHSRNDLFSGFVMVSNPL